MISILEQKGLDLMEVEQDAWKNSKSEVSPLSSHTHTHTINQSSELRPG